MNITQTATHRQVLYVSLISLSLLIALLTVAAAVVLRSACEEHT